MEFKDSVFQTAIYNEIKDSARRNLLINSVAGSGKTTTIVKALNFIPSNESTIFLAFNKDIVKELKTRVPQHVKVATLHSLGFKEVLFHFGKEVTVDDNKISKIIDVDSLTWGLTEEDRPAYCDRVEKLVNMFRFSLPQSMSEVLELCEKFDIELLNGEIDKAKEVLLKSRKNVSQFDFMDMIYFPAHRKDMRIKKFKNVFVDECQDLNPAQHAFLKKIVDPNGGRIIAVGDPFQAIYGFTGADVDSFNSLKKLFPNTIELPLACSYRCGSDIIKHAQQIVPHIEASEFASKGCVKAGSYKDIQDGDFVLCRNTKPLVSLCMKFISEGRKATIKGKDIGKNLINMVKSTKAKTNDGVFGALDRQYDKLIKKLKATNPNKDVTKLSTAVSMEDKINALRVISLECKSKLPEEMIDAINNIFSDTEKTGIILSTMHKSKGLEADNVFIIEAQLNPAFYAAKEWQMAQELNLMYVARTRAKKSLTYVEDWISDETYMKFLKQAINNLNLN